MKTQIPEPVELALRNGNVAYVFGSDQLKDYGAAEYKRAIDDVLHILTTMRMREGTLGKAIKLLGETS